MTQPSSLDSGSAMRPLAEWPEESRREIRWVLTDIDDTITLNGRLPAAGYAALERLQEAGIGVVPITGRPAGWCDHIARMWPVEGVVGENGAFWFRYDHAARKLRRRFVIDDATRMRDRQRLNNLAKRILIEVPGTALASDQPYREADLAIDFCEDVPPLATNTVQLILRLFEDAGATAKISSIHVNGWFGRYDKLTTTRLLFQEAFGLDLDTERNRCAFIGDSPNDAPMFGWFRHSFGVANVRRFSSQMPAWPAYVTSREGGDGFADFTATLLAGSG